MILPKKDSEASKNGDVKPAKDVKEPGVKLPVSSSTPDMKSLQIGVKIDTAADYTFSQNFKCPPTELYNVLTLPELMRAFTNAPAQVDPTVGGKFSLFDGQITGQYTKLVRTQSAPFNIRILLNRSAPFHSLGTEQNDSAKVEVQNLAGRPSFDGHHPAEGQRRFYGTLA